MATSLPGTGRYQIRGFGVEQVNELLNDDQD
jgi:hypothetical protein